MEDLSVSQWRTMQLTPHGIEQLSSCYCQAQKIGNNTANYIRLIIEHGKMERSIISGCVAILRLARLYGNEKIELGCQRALQGNRYNYKTIRTILANGMSNEAMIDQQEDDEDYKLTHQNLRGSDYFTNH